MRTTANTETTSSDERIHRTDGELLMRFVRHRDETAFAELVQKHGSVVMGVCQRVLRDRHDAEDAFQAVFLGQLRETLTAADQGKR